jgi:tryptophan synthase
MGTTGSSVTGKVNAELPVIISRVRGHTKVPLAVGFGVATRDHYNFVADAGADGVVVGSRLVSVIKEAPKGEIAQRVKQYCKDLSQKSEQRQLRSSPGSDGSSIVPDAPAAVATSDPLPMRFGQFGGQYVPEALFDCLAELDTAHRVAVADPEFWKEFESFYGYMNRPSKLYYAENLTKEGGGAGIWLKREDL